MRVHATNIKLHILKPPNEPSTPNGPLALKGSYPMVKPKSKGS